MRKVVIVLGILLFALSFASARCELAVTLLNQDPYPAVPGDYVKLLFQVTGTENAECTYVSFELLEKYPITFNPGESGFIQIKGGTFQRDYSSSLTVPYQVRLDENTLEGANRVEVVYGSGQNLTQFYTSKLFDIEVDDTHADFELYVKDYDEKTNTLTLEILNIAESDVEALTLEIPEQENVKIHGARTDIVGDLDSNEYTTAEFIIEPKQGNIKIKISYSDEINERRILEKEVFFNPEYFVSTEDQKTPWYTYLIYAIILVAIVYYFYNRRKKKKQRQHHRRGMSRLG